MTQEIKNVDIKISSSNCRISLDNIKHLVDTNISKMKTSLGTKSTTAKVISIVQGCPCLVKCTHEIQSTIYNSNFDSLYSAKHEYAKTKLIDAIVDRFSDLVRVSSEHNVPNGKLDIAIMPENKIVLKYNKKIIGIELKTGKFIDAPHLYQIERYLPECDMLLFIRILAEEVTIIERESVENNLTEGMSRLNRKISRITKGELVKVQGDWCKGCTADCNYKKDSRWTGDNKASLENFGNFIQNIENVISKTLAILEEELTRQTN